MLQTTLSPLLQIPSVLHSHSTFFPFVPWAPVLSNFIFHWSDEETKNERETQGGKMIVGKVIVPLLK